MPRVLIVDDHAFIRRGVRGILSAFPEWQLCGEADNGNDAVRMAEELRPEVIIMDLSMPGLNGLEATRQIRTREIDTKVVLLTLHESSELVGTAFSAGINGYLLKSDAEQELIRAMNVVIAGGTYVSPKFDPQFVNRVLQNGHSRSDSATR
jgi:DNA-binding NarL/FixJ family response regulator